MVPDGTLGTVSNSATRAGDSLLVEQELAAVSINNKARETDTPNMNFVWIILVCTAKSRYWPLFSLPFVPPVGFEPTINGLKVRCLNRARLRGH